MNFGESLGLHKLLLNKTHLILWWNQETWFVEASSLPGLYFWIILKRSRFSREIIEAAWNKNTLIDVACVCFLFFKSYFLSFSLIISWCHLDLQAVYLDGCGGPELSALRVRREDRTLISPSSPPPGEGGSLSAVLEGIIVLPLSSPLGFVPSTCPQPYAFRVIFISLFPKWVCALGQTLSQGLGIQIG